VIPFYYGSGTVTGTVINFGTCSGFSTAKSYGSGSAIDTELSVSFSCWNLLKNTFMLESVEKYLHAGIC
jgi:hypothetical protein